MTTQSVPPHTAVIYDVADVLDEIATTPKGRAQAQAIANRAAQIVIQAHPQAAMKELGPLLVAKYKAAATADESEAVFKARHGLTDADMQMLRIRLKAAPGMTTIELPADQVAALGGLDAVKQLIARAAAQPAGGSPLRDDQKAATKAQLGLNPNGMRDDMGRLIGAPIRDAQGNPLR